MLKGLFQKKQFFGEYPITRIIRYILFYCMKFPSSVYIIAKIIEKCKKLFDIGGGYNVNILYIVGGKYRI